MTASRIKRSVATALAACLTALLLAAPLPAGAATAGGASAEPVQRTHEYPGAPKDTKRCRKLLRKIERADKKNKNRRLKRLARKYNNTCRVK